MPNPTVVQADVFSFYAPERLVQNEFILDMNKIGGCIGGGGLYMQAKGIGETVAGLEGSPADFPWVNIYSGLLVGSCFWLNMGPYIKGGCRLAHVPLNCEVDSGSLTWLCSLKECAGTGTSDAFTDLDTGSATVSGSGRSQVDFALGGGAVVHGAAHSPSYTYYKLVFEITAKTGNPSCMGLYAIPFLWGENNLQALVGSATL